MQIIPTIAPNGLPFRPLPASEEAPALPRDQFAPGRSLEPRPQPPPGRARQALPEILRLERQIERGELGGEAYQQAARRIAEWSAAGQDPVLSRVASLALRRFFQWPDRVLDDQLKRGVRQAGEERCRQLGRGKQPSQDDLRAILDATRTERASPAMVRELLFATHQLYAQSEHPLADLALSVLRAWLRRGDFRVLDGQEDDLARTVRERAPLVDRHGTVRLRPLPPPPRPSPEAARRMDSLLRERDYVASFDALAAEHPTLAAEVAAALADQTDRAAMRVMGGILSRGTAAAAEHFKAHRSRLARTTERLEEAHDLGWNSSSWDHISALYRGLVERFPELVTPELLGYQLLPLVTRHINCERESSQILAERMTPEGAPLVMAQMLREITSGRILGEDHWKVVHACIDRGWKCGPVEREWLASLGYLPLSYQVLHSHAGFVGAAVALFKLGALDQVELPGLDGRPRPFREAFLERLLHDSKLEVYHLYRPQSHGLARLYDTILTDDQVVGMLLDRVERAGVAVEQMERPDQLAYALLGSIQLSESRLERFRRVNEKELYRDHSSYVFIETVDTFRQSRQQAMREIVTAPASTLDEVLEAAREHLRCDAFRRRQSVVDPVEEPFVARVLASGQLDAQVKRLSEGFLTAARDATSLEDLDLDLQVDACLALALAAVRPELHFDLLQRYDQAIAGKQAGALVEPLRNHADERSASAIALLAHCGDNHALRARIMQDSCSADPRVLDAWEESLQGQAGWVDEVLSLEEGSVQAYIFVASGNHEERWQAWTRLSDRLGEHPATLEAAREWAAFRAAGKSVEQADRLALARSVLGGQAQEPPAPVAVDEHKVVVGGVRLKVRQRLT